MEKIDVVIPWVDGNDPVLRQKHIDYGDPKALKFSDVGGETRFASIGEIFWCIASINRNMPWINKIWIITDNQDPHLESFLKENFPKGYIPYEIVDHTTIFRGYEQYLPVFNSNSIETLIYNIPELSDKYLLFNDDFLVIQPVTPEDFFVGDKYICYGDKFSIAWERVMYSLKPKKNGHKPFSFKKSMLNAADIVGSKGYFYYLRHTPRSQDKRFFQEFYSKHPEYVIQNIKDRFRSIDQYEVQELFYLAMKKEGRCIGFPTKKVAFYVEPKGAPGYYDSKLDKLEAGNYKFCCFNSADQATEKERERVYAWVKKVLDIKF